MQVETWAKGGGRDFVKFLSHRAGGGRALTAGREGWRAGGVIQCQGLGNWVRG